MLLVMSAFLPAGLQMFAAAQKSEDPRLLFYAPFEDSTDATVAGGNPKALRAIVKFEDGKVGKAVRSIGGSYQRLAYDGRGNIDLNAGTLAFFTSRITRSSSAPMSRS